MSATVRIWLEAAHHASFRVGGWAFLRLHAGALRGTAGGARRVDAHRASLLAIASALADLEPGAAVEFYSASAIVLEALDGVMAAEAGSGAPPGELAQWTATAVAVRRARPLVGRIEATPGGPAAFAAAWADLALDRAKARGDFTAAIPRANLAKAGV